MKKKILIIVFCILLISTTLPAVESLKNNVTPLMVPSTINQSCSLENWIEIQKILAPDVLEYDDFGSSISIFGDTALIGEHYDDDNGWCSGSAYVFTRTGTTWTQQAKLLASDSSEYDYFGSSVSIFGDTALIGAYGSASAYVFTRTGTIWTQQAKLLASDGAIDDYFGNSVLIDSDTVLIGARGDDDNGYDSGSAYVFTRTGTTWTQQAKLLASDGTEYDGFGCSVSLDGDTTLTGAPELSSNNGSVYVFMREAENQPPYKPVRQTGKINGKVGVEYIYTTHTTDPDEDQVYYWFDWGDGNSSGWVGPYASGAAGSANHTWSKKGTYQIKVKAKDSFDAESEWSDPLEVTMPRYKIVNRPILKLLQSFLQSHPNLFPIQKLLLQQLGL
jgi:hypothetical protein